MGGTVGQCHNIAQHLQGLCTINLCVSPSYPQGSVSGQPDYSNLECFYISFLTPSGILPVNDQLNS